jgi:hypothetical protein
MRIEDQCGRELYELGWQILERVADQWLDAFGGELQ